MFHCHQMHRRLLIYIFLISCSGTGGQTAVQNYRQLPADLEVPGVPWAGGCALLCYELHPRECGQSHGQKQRGRRTSLICCSCACLLIIIVFSMEWILCVLTTVGLSCSSQAVLPVYQNNVFTLMSNIIMPTKESELTNFMVKQEGETCFMEIFLIIIMLISSPWWCRLV